MADKPTSFEQARALTLGLKLGAKMPDRLPKNVRRACYCLGLLDISPARAGWRVELRARAIQVRAQVLMCGLQVKAMDACLRTMIAAKNRKTRQQSAINARALARGERWRQLNFRYATAREAKVLRHVTKSYLRVIAVIPGDTEPYVVGQRGTAIHANGHFKTVSHSTRAIVCGEIHLTGLMKGTK